MSDVMNTNVGFEQLRRVGQFQLLHLWKIRIYKPALVSSVTQDDIDTITLIARTLSGIPGYVRSKVKIRYMDREFTVPAGRTVSGDHEFSCDILFDENNRVYDTIFKWFMEIPHIVATYGLMKAKANGDIYLYSIDGVTLRRQFRVDGIYPLEVPEMTGWDQDSSDNHLKVTLKFAFDEVSIVQ